MSSISRSHQNPNQLFISNTEHELGLYDVETNQILRKCSGFEVDFENVSIGSESDLVYGADTTETESNIKVADLRVKSRRQSYILIELMNKQDVKSGKSRELNRKYSVFAQESKNNLFVGDKKGLHCVDLRTHKIKWSNLDIHSEIITTIDAISESQQILSGSWDGLIKSSSDIDGSVTRTFDFQKNINVILYYDSWIFTGGLINKPLTAFKV